MCVQVVTFRGGSEREVYVSRQPSVTMAWNKDVQCYRYIEEWSVSSSSRGTNNGTYFRRGKKKQEYCFPSHTIKYMWTECYQRNGTDTELHLRVGTVLMFTLVAQIHHLFPTKGGSCREKGKLSRMWSRSNLLLHVQFLVVTLLIYIDI